MNDQFLIRIATRTSQLAIWQSNLVASLLRERQPEVQVELVKVVTEGDRRIDTPLSKIGGKSLFIKELEVAMLDGRADIAVHSMKDIPNQLPDQFSIMAILKREDFRDVLLSQEGYTPRKPSSRCGSWHIKSPTKKPIIVASAGSIDSRPAWKCAYPSCETKER